MGLECLKLLDPERDGVLKRSIPNLQLSTTRPADYPIFGSSTEVRNRVLDVGFTPKNRHYVAGWACPFRASNGHSDRGGRDDWYRLWASIVANC
jgi:hypothetical protein